MPYIKQVDRLKFDRFLSEFNNWQESCQPGDINYFVTRLMDLYWNRDPCYARLALITGILENVKQEFYRRVAEPYEDRKKEIHGDVYQNLPQ